MADAEMVKFNKAVEKLCLDCAGDVGKLLATCRNSAISRMDKLARDLAGLEVPKSAPAELAKVPNQVSAILKRESSRFEKIAILTAAVRIDAGGKLTVPAAGVSGPLVTV